MADILGVSYTEFIEVAEAVFSQLTTVTKADQVTTGAYLTLVDSRSEEQQIGFRLGESIPAKSAKKARRKAKKLCSIRRGHGYFSGWTNGKKYGGAITTPANSQSGSRGAEIIGSVHGLSQHGNEAVITVIWMIFRWIVLSDMEAIIEISENPLTRPLLEACNDLFDREIHT